MSGSVDDNPAGSEAKTSSDVVDDRRKTGFGKELLDRRRHEFNTDDDVAAFRQPQQIKRLATKRYQDTPPGLQPWPVVGQQGVDIGLVKADPSGRPSARASRPNSRGHRRG